jgi:2-amino-4-hydroxy-6-hydroxymethyldihydropteridine diphosphokinase
MILIGLGSSLSFCGRPSQEVIRMGVRTLGAHFGLRLVSGLYSSAAWPDPSDPAFINAAVALAGAPEPEALLHALHGIEAAFGRKRDRKNAPRTLDLDLLAYGDIVRAGALALPHPGLASRDFVLAPLAEIAPDYRPPGQDRTVASLLARLGAAGARKVGA